MSVALFLDRDGVINRKPAEGDYVRAWDQFEFLPGAIDALRRLTERGPGPLIVVTNQRGIALGLMSAADVDDIHARMQATLRAHGARIAAVHVCPHDIGMCDCRKPALGLFEQAASADPLLDFEGSAVVGDSLSDLEAANRLGCATYAISPDPEALVEAARLRGIHVDGSAASLLDLAESGVLDRPDRNDDALAVTARGMGATR